MSLALYRKYRSKTLGDIVGQQHVTSVLARSLQKGLVAHAYLLTGPRGIGKTSIARILAHEINQVPYRESGAYLDIIEIDAASNNGVEDIRDLREKVQIAPVAERKKVYIIDEVHMLSKPAFNALLKTLEEPPEHVVFILATTDVDKLPATIISRTQRFSLRPITTDDLTKHLRSIADQEDITITDDALKLLSRHGDGSFRDSISLLDQLRSLPTDKKGITAELIEQALGLAPKEHIAQLLKAYEAKELGDIVKLLDESERLGIQPAALTTQLIDAVRDIITQKPQLLPLLDQLLEVSKSSHPGLKLLTILGASAHNPKPKTAALTAPPAEVRASIKELKEQPLKERAAAKSTEERVTSDGAARLNWAALITYTREHSVAIYSVLSKCGYHYSDDTLTLYTGNSFYKKKLDDTKYRTNLSAALREMGLGEVAITTIGTPPPPKDGAAAAVAVIMGGGEEVKVDA